MDQKVCTPHCWKLFACNYGLWGILGLIVGSYYNQWKCMNKYKSYVNSAKLVYYNEQALINKLAKLKLGPTKYFQILNVWGISKPHFLQLIARGGMLGFVVARPQKPTCLRLQYFWTNGLLHWRLDLVEISNLVEIEVKFELHTDYVTAIPSGSKLNCAFKRSTMLVKSMKANNDMQLYASML